MLSYVEFWIATPFEQRSPGNGSRTAFNAGSWKAVDDVAAPLAMRAMEDHALGPQLEYAQGILEIEIRGSGQGT